MKNCVIIILLALFLILPFSSCAPEETLPADKPNLPEAQSPGITAPAPSIVMQSDLDALFTKTVIESDLIVLGTITNKKYEIVTVGPTDNASQEARAREPKGESISAENIIPGKFTYTIFTLSIEEVIKGDPNTKEVFIRVIGGLEGTPGPQPFGPYFSISDRALVCLLKLEGNMYNLFHRFAGGVLYLESAKLPRFNIILNGVAMDLEKWIVKIITIMKANDIPVAMKITYLSSPSQPPPPLSPPPSPPQTDQPQPIPQPAPPAQFPSTPTPTPIDPIHELTQLIEKCAFIVLGTITDKKYEVRAEIQYDKSTRDYVYTIFTLTVEKVIKGYPDIKEVFIETTGGLGQKPSRWYFSIGNRGLISLYRQKNYYGVYRLLWGECAASVKPLWSLPVSELEEIIGLIIRIMKEKNFTIALPESEWPPLPATVPVISRTK